jgi:hypothetical protein
VGKRGTWLPLNTHHPIKEFPEPILCTEISRKFHKLFQEILNENRVRKSNPPS